MAVFVTKRALFQGAFGFVVSILSPLIYGVGLIVALGLYSFIKDEYPEFGIGMVVGFCVIVPAVIFLFLAWHKAMGA